MKSGIIGVHEGKTEPKETNKAVITARKAAIPIRTNDQTLFATCDASSRQLTTIMVSITGGYVRNTGTNRFE